MQKEVKKKRKKIPINLPSYLHNGELSLSPHLSWLNSPVKFWRIFSPVLRLEPRATLDPGPLDLGPLDPGPWYPVLLGCEWSWPVKTWLPSQVKAMSVPTWFLNSDSTLTMCGRVIFYWGDRGHGERLCSLGFIPSPPSSLTTMSGMAPLSL
jgi:hypothetical protein